MNTRITYLKYCEFCCWHDKGDSFIEQWENWRAISLRVHHSIGSLQLTGVLCGTGWLEMSWSAITSAGGVTQKRIPFPLCSMLIHQVCTYSVTEKPACSFAWSLHWSDAVLRVVHRKSEGNTSSKLLLLEWVLQYRMVVLNTPCWLLISTKQILTAQRSLRRYVRTPCKACGCVHVNSPCWAFCTWC